MPWCSICRALSSIYTGCAACKQVAAQSQVIQLSASGSKHRGGHGSTCGILFVLDHQVTQHLVLLQAREKVLYKKKEGVPEGLYM